MLPDEQLSLERLAVIRGMTPAQRWAEAEKLYWEARRLKESEVRSQNPEWPEQKVRLEVRRIFLAEAMKES